MDDDKLVLQAHVAHLREAIVAIRDYHDAETFHRASDLCDEALRATEDTPDASGWLAALQARVADLEAALRGVTGDCLLYDSRNHGHYCKFCFAPFGLYEIPGQAQDPAYHEDDCVYIRALAVLNNQP